MLGGAGRAPPRHALSIVDRPLARARGEAGTVSLSAFAHLFAALISYSVDRAASITELEERLDRAGYEVGARVMELLSWREKQPRRRPDPLDALKFVHSVAWPALFGRPAADLQQAHAADDEFMIRDDDLLVSRYVSVPRGYATFVPGSLVAGIVRGMLDAAGLPAHVSAHIVEPSSGGGGGGSTNTTILVKFGATAAAAQRPAAGS